MRRIGRILPLLALAGVLAMHGVDATTTAHHAVHAPDAAHTGAAAHELHLSEPEATAATTERRAHSDMQHVVALCIAALVGGLGYAGRRLLGRLASATTHRSRVRIQSVSRRLDEFLPPRPPAWVRLCALRR